MKQHREQIADAVEEQHAAGQRAEKRPRLVMERFIQPSAIPRPDSPAYCRFINVRESSGFPGKSCNARRAPVAFAHPMPDAQLVQREYASFHPGEQ